MDRILLEISRNFAEQLRISAVFSEELRKTSSTMQQEVNHSNILGDLPEVNAVRGPHDHKKPEDEERVQKRAVGVLVLCF